MSIFPDLLELLRNYLLLCLNNKFLLLESSLNHIVVLHMQRSVKHWLLVLGALGCSGGERRANRVPSPSSDFDSATSSRIEAHHVIRH